MTHLEMQGSQKVWPQGSPSGLTTRLAAPPFSLSLLQISTVGGHNEYLIHVTADKADNSRYAGHCNFIP